MSWLVVVMISLHGPYSLMLIIVATNTSSRHHTTRGVAKQLVHHDEGTTAARAIGPKGVCAAEAKNLEAS